MDATRFRRAWPIGVILALVVGSASGEEVVDPLVVDDEQLPALFPPEWHQLAGIEWSLHYTGEVFNNARGGISTAGATRYRGNVELGLTFDTAANQWWEHGVFYLGASNTHGETLSEQFVGDWQLYSNIDSFPRPHINQVSEYWYRHGGEESWFKLGKCDGWGDFANVDMAEIFVQTSVTFPPTLPIPTWPNQALGLVGYWQPRDDLDFKTALYDGAGDGRLWGFTTLGDNGAFLIGEARWLPKLGDDDNLAGIYRLGAWQHTGDFADETDFENFSLDTRGVYLSGEQMLRLEAGSGVQGLGLFGQFSAGEGPARFNQIETYWSLGLLYTGLLEGRDDDCCGVMINNIRFQPGTSATIVRTYETVIETFYSVQLRPWLRVQPDLQYIANPGGVERDALVVGLRFEAAL